MPRARGAAIITNLPIIALGLLLGMRHATDPDHVIAIATIVTRQRRLGSAALVGLVWGVGHTVTVTLVGALIVAFGVVIPPRLGLAMEFSVALMLIVLGILNVTGRLRGTAARVAAPDLHAHPHQHADDFVHTHPHGHAPGAHGHGEGETPVSRLDRLFGRLGPYQVVRPLVVGLVHGLAGSAAVALLVLATIRDPRWAVAYLLLFGLGTIAGMMLITVGLSLPLLYASGRFEGFHRHLRLASGVLSLAFGLFLAYEIGITDGLFTASPHWDPH